MHVTRLLIYAGALILAVVLAAYLFACAASAQGSSAGEQRDFAPDMQRAIMSRTETTRNLKSRDNSATLRAESRLEARPRVSSNDRTVARPRGGSASNNGSGDSSSQAVSGGSENISSISTRIRAGTPLSRVLHTSQLSLTSSAGSDEQFVDRTGDLVADERTTFDSRGGSFDIAVGRSGARYEVYSAVDDRGTSSTNDDVAIGVLVVALDTNNDYVRDSSSTFDLHRDFNLPSAAAVVSGTSKAGSEFVIVSSSGYYNFNDTKDPNNEPSAGVVLLVRDPNTNGFDNARSRELVRAGNNQLNNANALALLPNNDLLIADFDSNKLRIVRDTNSDGIPDTLDATPFYSYRYSNDAPLDVAVNARGVVFSHSFGNDAVLLAIYDDNRDGRGDRDEVVVEGLSLDNNLFLHGLTVDREGNVYVIEDASGAADLASLGGNLGAPRIDAFPDPNMDGFLLNGPIYAVADDANAQSLSGLAFASLAPNQINDAQFFVAQHYRDFLNREPDAGGLAYWTARVMQNCAANDAACINANRVSVSAAFFIELEFQETGSFVYRMYKASYGVRPLFTEFVSDRNRVVSGSALETSKQAFAGEWVGRARFLQTYPATMSPSDFVNKLFDTAALAPYTIERGRLIDDMQLRGKTRAQVLREVIEIQAFKQREYNPSFVLMQYFGYLRRDPDEAGYQFWLNVLNNKDANNFRGMVCAFLTSAEYQDRFGLARARSNTDCGQ